MNKYFKYLALFSLSTAILLEITIRVFNLAGHTVPTENINSNLLLKPGSDGVWVRGGLGEISSDYIFNSQGWNSLIDYDRIPDDKISVALIGDSYIEGFQSDVKNSIGRQLEDLMSDSVVVHEYGRAGGNIKDFSVIYNTLVADKYDYVFILITDKDLEETKPSFMGRGDRVPPDNFIRKIYDESSLIRYLNINHGLGVKLRELVSNGPESINKIHGVSTGVEQLYINDKAINEISKDVVFLYEKGKLNEKFIKNSLHSTREINHVYLPKDHGFDGHWNINGRKNCALTIKNYITISSKI